MLSAIVEGILDIIFEVLVHPFLFILYITGIILLKAVNYETDSIRKFNFFAFKNEDKSDEMISHRFPIKIGLIFWIFAAILSYILLVAI